MRRRGKVLFMVPVSTSFSGQMAAALMLRDLYTRSGRPTILVRIPVFSRNNASALPAALAYTIHYLGAMLHSFTAGLTCDSVYLTPGQTRVGILRDWFLFRLATVRPRQKRALALHGSLFMEWDNTQSFARRRFISLLNRSNDISVLGRGHVEKLAALGIPRVKIHHIPNPTDLSPLASEAVEAKHAHAPDAPIRVLYLSSLIDTKGYPEFLEALLRIATLAQQTPPIKATLCGPLTANALSDRFATQQEARSWIESTIASINTSPHVTCEWIEGASGQAKTDLLHSAHIFVLPTRYRNEAQPLSIIEALASGAAVISTKIGEIEHSFCGASTLLDTPHPDSLAQAITALAQDASRRQHLARVGLDLYRQQFTCEKHFTHWERIL